MSQLINKLIELADRIGNGATVSIECKKKEDGSHSFSFCVKWPTNQNFRSREMSYENFVKNINKQVEYLADVATQLYQINERKS